MKSINKISSIIIELETSIKLLEYLKRNSIVDNEMYDFCINKLIGKLELERSKVDDNYKILI